MDQALNLRASYGMSFVSILMKNDRVIKGFYCIRFYDTTLWNAIQQKIKHYTL